MASDDLVRIVYRPKRMSNAPGAGGAADTGKAPKAVVRRNRTSISMDPDLYDTFVMIEGDARTARHTLRKWATEADSSRDTRSENVGVSRLVHKQMLAKIREVVRAGLTVIQQKGVGPVADAGAPAARAAGEDDVGAAWDNFGAPAGAVDAKKAIKKAKASAKKAPGKKGSDATPPRAGFGLDGLDASDGQREAATADAAGGSVVASEWTRERDPGADAPDPFM